MVLFTLNIVVILSKESKYNIFFDIKVFMDGRRL